MSKHDDLYDSLQILRRGSPPGAIFHVDVLETWEAAKSKKLSIASKPIDSFLEEISYAVDRWPFELRRLLGHGNWNIPHLIDRAQKKSSGREDVQLAKPRISLSVEITSKGNLSARWHPRGEDRDNYNVSDFLDYFYQSYDQPYGWERPENEFLFIHDVWKIDFLIHGGLENVAASIVENLQDILSPRWLFPFIFVQC